MKGVGPGMGLFLCIGTGLGIGLTSGRGWGLYALVGAVLIAIASVVLRSEHYRGYIQACRGKQVEVDSPFLRRLLLRGGRTEPTRPSVALYIVLSFLQNSVIIFAVALIVFAVKGFLRS